MKITIEFPKLQAILDEHAARMSKLSARMNQQMEPFMKSFTSQTAPIVESMNRINRQVSPIVESMNRINRQVSPIVESMNRINRQMTHSWHKMLMRDLESTPQRHETITSHTSYAMYA